MKKVPARLMALGSLYLAVGAALQGCEQPSKIRILTAQTDGGTENTPNPSSTTPSPGASPNTMPGTSPGTLTSGTLSGSVTDAQNGQCISTFTVAIKKTPGTASSATLVTQQLVSGCGKYSFSNLPAGNYFVDFTQPSYIPALDIPVGIAAGNTTDKNISLSKPISNNQYRIVLNWMSKPGNNFCDYARDLDAYLLTDYPVSNNIVYWGNTALANGAGGTPDVVLDHDVRNWVGPETVTIQNLNLNRTYRYYVNNYNNRNNPNALGNANATVSVYQGSIKIKDYQIPAGVGISYEVFDIVNGQIVDVGAYKDNLHVSQSQTEPCDWIGPLVP